MNLAKVGGSRADIDDVVQHINWTIRQQEHTFLILWPVTRKSFPSVSSQYPDSLDSCYRNIAGEGPKVLKIERGGWLMT